MALPYHFVRTNDSSVCVAGYEGACYVGTSVLLGDPVVQLLQQSLVVQAHGGHQAAAVALAAAVVDVFPFERSHLAP